MRKIAKLNHAFLYCCLVALFCMPPKLFLTAQSAPPVGKAISLVVKNSSLADILRQVSKKSELMIYFQDADLAEFNNVSINVKNKPVESILHELLDGRGLTWVEVTKSTIAIKKKEGQGNNERIFSPQDSTISISGKVSDEKGNPIIGATVVVKGTKIGTTTGSDGEFVLQGVKKNVTIIITNIAYLTIEVSIKGKSNLGIIQLREYVDILNETVIIAYGTAKKRFLTGNTVVVSGDEIARQPVNNPLLALQGRVPGLFVSSTNGLPGSSVNVTIQGINSFRTEGRAPFFVVDGVPYAQNFTTASLNANAISNGGQGGSTLNFINPADIESISILKDADATAIYGSRASNGAILITTKKANTGKTKVDFNLQQGFGSLAHKYKYLNTRQYLEMRKEAYGNANLPVPNSNSTPTQDDYDLTVWNQNRYTDWQEELVGGTAQYTDLRASVSAGSANTQFLLGYGYNRQTTVYPNSLADQKANVHFNINHNSTNGKFNVMLNASYLHDHNRLNGSDLMADAIRLAPNAPVLYNADGTLNWEPLPNNPAVYSFSNPMVTSLQPYTGITENLTANNSISYEVIPGLHLKTTMGYNRLQGDESSFKPMAAIKPDLVFGNRTASFLNKSIISWIVEPQATYTKSTPFGNFDALLGGTLQQSNTNALQQTGSNYANDAQLGSLLAAPTITLDNVIKNMYKYNAIFGRLNYRLHDKYILNLTARRDGSSRFGNANKFHTFYAVGGAWLFGDEGFSKSVLPWLSVGKIRANYGTTGNDQINDYAYESLLENYRVNQAYLGVTGIYPTSIANPYLQWEETRKLNFGIDLGFFNNLIEISVNYFRNRSSNQLLSPLLPYVTGFQSVTQNLPAIIQNTGLELMLTVTPIRNSNFTWQASINFTNPRNKLIEYPGLGSSTNANAYVIGEPVNLVQKFKFAGVNPETGYYEFFDAKGNKTYDPSYLTDIIARYDPNPKYYGGFSNTITYKGFQLDFLFQGVKQMGENYRLGNLPGFSINQPISVLERWQTEGQVANIQKYSSGFEDFDAFLRYYTAITSDANYSDASYIRLKNAALSYTINTEWLQKARISSARIFMQGQNLLTITKFKGTDPETMTASILPPLKIFTLGAQFSF